MNWWDVWIKAGIVNTETVGRTVQEVPLKGGGVCGRVNSGSYYTEGRVAYLCIPLKTIDGGLQPLPGGGISPGDTDGYFLEITTNPGQTLELVGGVYQARNADGSAASYVNPVDNDKGKAGKKIDGEYVAPMTELTGTNLD
jgi:hypothetical protein